MMRLQKTAKSKWIWFFLFLWLPLVLTCGKIPTTFPFGDFCAIIISDTHISNDAAKDARLRKLISKINNDDFPGVDFLVDTGDVVSSVYDKYDSLQVNQGNNRLAKAVDIFKLLNVPYYLVMGNHDYKIDSDRDSDAPFAFDEISRMEKLWKGATGFSPWYSFTHKGWKFIVLDSMHGRYQGKHFDKKELDWLASQLEDKMPTVLFFHHPLKTDHLRIWCGFRTKITDKKEPRFYSMLRAHRKTIKGVFVGHGHRWVHDVLFGSVPVYETDSFGEEPGLNFLIVGFDNELHKIHVGKFANSSHSRLN